MNTTSQDPRSAQAGYSVLELMIAVVIMVPLLGNVVGSEQLVLAELSTQTAAANAAEVCSRACMRILPCIRSGYVSTLRTRATQADVDTATAANALDPNVVIPTLGDWIEVPPGSTRSTISLRSADGILSMNALTMTVVREFAFTLDSGESDNDADDDGDGLVDEGVLTRWEGGQPKEVASGIEACTFHLEGRTVSIDLRCARVDSNGRVIRRGMTQQAYLRNN